MSLSPCTILLVEDDPNDVLLIRRAFRKTNLANPIQVVEDGEEAIAYLSGAETYADRAAHPEPGLMLLDLKLPRKSGLEVLEWLQQQPRLLGLPVVVLTSSHEHIDIKRAYELGANSYLVKPVEFDKLLEMVNTIGIYWMILNQSPGIGDEKPSPSGKETT